MTERTVPLYRVIMRDGTEHENLTQAEALPFISGENEGKWAQVQPMGYGHELDPENANQRKAWGM